MIKHSLSVIMPAFNEEKAVRRSAKHTLSVLKKAVRDYELIIIDDGSKDRTGEIADKLSLKNSKIRVFHNERNMGLGYNCWKGIKFAKKKYLTWLPADDETDYTSLKDVLSHIGDADIIIPYIINPEMRSLFRRLVSKSFVFLLNFLFKLDVKYYTGTVIFKTNIARKVKKPSSGFAFMPEAIVNSIKLGYSYKQVPMKIGKRAAGKTTIFKLKNIISVIGVVIRLVNTWGFRKRWKE